MTMLENFTDWLKSAWADHPIYTLMFGGICFVIGGIIL